MNIEIVSRPGASAAKITLAPEETLTSEAGSMIAVNNGVSITTTTRKKSSGGIFKAAKRLLAGESFFLNHYTGLHEGGEVFLASNLPGDMTVLVIRGLRRNGGYRFRLAGTQVYFIWRERLLVKTQRGWTDYCLSIWSYLFHGCRR